MNTKQLRKKILDLAIHGKLVPQDSSDEPASVLLERVHAEKERLIKEGKIKRDKKDSTITRAADKSRYGKLLYEIPENWCWAKIIDIAVLKSGGQYQLGNDDNSYLYIKVSDMNKKNNLTEINISDVRCTCKTSELVPINSIIFPKRGGAILTNKKRLNIKHPIAIDSNIMALTPFSGVELLYVRLWLESFDLSQLWTGNVVPQINNQDIYPLYIPIPPLAEQHRIISAIESAFAVIDEIERNKTDLQSAVAATKQKILSLAIRGKLVKQDPNDESASVLLERIRSEREKLINDGKIKRGKGDSAVIRGGDSPYYEKLPRAWELVSLSQITNPLILNDGDWILSENMVKNGNIKLIQLGSVGFMEYIDKGFKYLTAEVFSELSCTAIYPNYLLINRLLGDRLNLCILPNINGTLITTVDTCWIAPNENYSIKFLMYSIASRPFQESVFINSAGSTRKRISKGNLIQIPIAFPPLAEQYRIVTTIETAFEQLDNISAALM